ncbi:hypothetical protein [Sorangium sp. So ce388]|uniref:hypothetical protein n=1 Tax=Sorangium sp. So ce388 TaxID=3133309 RepID=UPI003F5C34F8
MNVMGGSSRAEDAAAGRLRGEALVDYVIETLQAGGQVDRRRFGKAGPTPLPPDRLAGLTLDKKGRPLPPSLRRWLAFSALDLGFIEDVSRPALRGLPIVKAAEAAFPGWGDSFREGFKDVLPGSCLLFKGDGESRHFLYAGEPDTLGEYPIFQMSIDDFPFVALDCPGLDVFLAQRYGVLSYRDDLFKHDVLGASMREQALLNFGGYRSYDFPAGVTNRRIDEPDED